MKYQIVKGSAEKDVKGRWCAEVTVRSIDQARFAQVDATGTSRNKEPRLALRDALFNAFDQHERRRKRHREAKR